MFKGYSLIRLNKAVDANSGPDAYTYDVTIVDVLGRSRQAFLHSTKLDRDWTKLRMNGDRFAKMVSGTVTPITEEEFNRLSN